MADLTRLESEVQVLREQLARLQQEHTDLVVELNEFETVYNARVGPVQARLEEAQLHIAEYKLRIELLQWRGKSLAPSQLEAEVEYRLRDQRQHAQATYEQAEHARSAPPAPPIDPAANLDLKQIYRELAKRTHPDLAIDPADRAGREQRMKDINTLYAKRDLDALRNLLRQIQTSELRQRETPEQWQARLQREHDRLIAAIKRVKSDIAELDHSPLMALKLDYALGRSRRRDVLGEVAAKVQVKLDEAESELQQLIATFMKAVEAGMAE